LHGVEDPTSPVLEKIRNVTDRVTVRNEVPASGTIAVIVQPGAKDQIGGNPEENTAVALSVHYR
jgi:hypothetical protein